MEVLIQQKEVSPVFTFTKLIIRNVSVVPFKYARIAVELQFDDSSGLLTLQQRIVNRSVEMTKEIYDNWTTDEYLVDFVLSKLDFTKPI